MFHCIKYHCGSSSLCLVWQSPPPNNPSQHVQPQRVPGRNVTSTLIPLTWMANQMLWWRFNTKLDWLINSKLQQACAIANLSGVLRPHALRRSRCLQRSWPLLRYSRGSCSQSRWQLSTGSSPQLPLLHARHLPTVLHCRLPQPPRPHSGTTR